jgi:hypothetical protein
MANRIIQASVLGTLLWLAPELRAASLMALTAPQRWALLEYRVNDLPAAANPFDPDVISVDANFTLPSGKQMFVPAFWYQVFARKLVNGQEVLSAQGIAEWRLRFTPPEEGNYRLSLTVRTNGQPAGQPLLTNFVAAPAASSASSNKHGFVRIAANNRFFETDQNQALPLIGACVCWPGARGTRDYDDWFGAMHQAGENYARLWMAPWAFGLETDPGTLTHYRLDHAWQLDYVLQLAEQTDLYLLLCLDYHGMFETQPDYWGGNNYWTKNPYNVAQGGPCTNQNAFFTNAVAKQLYQKRLRYLVARYGYSTHLLAWQFFNEIDNEYQYLNATDVAAWHGSMGDWLKANDPYRHLVTTSLTGSSDRPEIWRLPQMDFADYHSYNLAQPTAGLGNLINSFLTRYQKPVLIDEYGVDWRGWGGTNDPFYRGWRQGIWAGALGGSVGTSMSWYWESIHGENLYPYYRALADFTAPTSWGKGHWDPVTFQTSGDPPTTTGDLVVGGRPFTATLQLNAQWGPKLAGQLAVTAPISATLAAGALNTYFQGSAHPDLRIPFRLNAWWATNALLVMHLNSVSSGAILTVLVDGRENFRKTLPNLDGSWNVNNEYNQDIPVDLPAGKHLVEIKNAGSDWFYLDWVRLENVLPSQYPGGWQPSPAAVGIRGEGETLVYVVSPQVNYPANATNQVVEPLRGASLVLQNLPAGRYQARWFSPVNGQPMGTSSGVSDGTLLNLPLPEFTEDAAGRLQWVKDFGFQSPLLNGDGSFQTVLTGEAGQVYSLERSTDLRIWEPLVTVTNQGGSVSALDLGAKGFNQLFYRAQLAE